jgi:hypothetical protein
LALALCQEIKNILTITNNLRNGTPFALLKYENDYTITVFKRTFRVVWVECFDNKRGFVL